MSNKRLKMSDRVNMWLTDPVQRADFERELAAHGLTLGTATPVEPTDDMITASMRAVNFNMSAVDKRTKHTIRLRAALSVLHLSTGKLKK